MFQDRIEEVRERLASDEPQRRVDAGRAIRAVAAADPTILEPHRETVLELLTDRHGSIRLSGAIGVAELADAAPESVAGTVPDLLDLLEETHAPAIEEATLRALTRIGRWSPEAVADADEITAAHLRSATTPIRTMVASYFTDVVVANPSLFPATISALEDVLENSRTLLQHRAAIVLADVATEVPSAVSSLADIQAQIEALAAKARAQPMKRGETVVDAAETLRSLCDNE